jgi:hypothetical protein
VIEILFLSGADVDELALTNEEVLAAVEDAARAQGRTPSSSSRGSTSYRTLLSGATSTSSEPTSRPSMSPA